MGNAGGKEGKGGDGDSDVPLATPTLVALGRNSTPSSANSSRTPSQVTSPAPGNTPPTSLPISVPGDSIAHAVMNDDEPRAIFGSPIEDLPPLSTRQPHQIVVHVPLGGTVNYMLRWDGPGEKVAAMGSFDEWKNHIPLKKNETGQFVAYVKLSPGMHEFKYLVDGEWKHDASQPTVQNCFGSVNNMLVVEESTENSSAAAAAALEEELDTIMGPDGRLQSRKSGASASGKVDIFEPSDFDLDDFASNLSGRDTPPGEYGQRIPHDYPGNPPQSLPPFLLQSTLNCEPFGNDPTQLPPPNHVMLNHLYALSVKDGVMVLGATHRYKKKFVTTCLYKPVSI